VIFLPVPPVPPKWNAFPGASIGVLLAGFLGWILAKSMRETRGMFWAWFIHFWQDVLIFSFLVLGSIVPGGAYPPPAAGWHYSGMPSPIRAKRTGTSGASACKRIIACRA
jgi:hypothetical protein